MRPIDLPISTVAAAALPVAPKTHHAASPWPIFWVSSIAVFLVSLDTTMLYAVFDSLRAGFHEATAPELSWVINAYTVVYAALLIPAGGLADTHGRKKVFLIGVTLFLAASAACGLSGHIGVLIAARVVQAIGAALLTPASLSMVLAAFPQDKRAVVVASWGAVGAVAAAIGPSLGSLMADRFGWPWAFYINLPLGAISLWKGATLLKEARVPEARRHVDLVGMLLLIVGVGAITLTIVEAESVRWSAVDHAAVALLGATCVAAFIAWARVAKAPLVDLSLFKVRTYSFVNLATFTYGTAFAMMFFTFFFYMRAIWHYSLPQAGLAIAPGPLLVAPVAVLSGRIAARFGHRPLLVGGALVYGSSGLWYLLVPGIEPAYLTHWLPGLLLAGIGTGMTLPSLSAAAVNRLPIHQYAVGSAVNQATRQIGAVIGVALTVLLLGHGQLVRADFTPVYATHVALAIITALLCLPVNTRPAPIGKT
jgi:EmrB/QacA subfamily drug resistance transporter